MHMHTPVERRTECYPLTVYRGNVAQAADIKLTSTAVQCEVSETVHFDAGQNTGNTKHRNR